MKVDNYQVWARDLFSGACYAACISYMSGKDDPIAITRDILNGVEKGYIDDDGYVSKPHLFANMCRGEDLFRDVRKPAYKPEPFHQIVCFEYDGGTHFVVMRDNIVVFDPSGNSKSVKYGIPTTVREFV